MSVWHSLILSWEKFSEDGETVEEFDEVLEQTLADWLSGVKEVLEEIVLSEGSVVEKVG